MKWTLAAAAALVLVAAVLAAPQDDDPVGGDGESAGLRYAAARLPLGRRYGLLLARQRQGREQRMAKPTAKSMAQQRDDCKTASTYKDGCNVCSCSEAGAKPLCSRVAC